VCVVQRCRVCVDNANVYVGGAAHKHAHSHAYDSSCLHTRCCCVLCSHLLQQLLLQWLLACQAWLHQQGRQRLQGLVVWLWFVRVCLEGGQRAAGGTTRKRKGVQVSNCVNDSKGRVGGPPCQPSPCNSWPRSHASLWLIL
jgi:hypothetical protein